MPRRVSPARPLPDPFDFIDVERTVQIGSLGLVEAMDPGFREDEAGAWWRFDRYEYRRGFITPADGAVLHRYTAMPSDPPLGSSPYMELLEAVSELEPQETSGGTEGVRLRPGSEEKLLGWCSRYGLLGLLPHRCLFAVVPRPPGVQTYVRTPRGWRIRRELFSRPAGSPRASRARRHAAMAGRVLADPGALMSDWRGVNVDWHPIERAWGRYFPSVVPVRRASHPYPRPTSEEFWMAYAEPLDEFVVGALALLQHIEALSHEADGVVGQNRADPIKEIEILASAATPWLQKRDRVVRRVTWTAPSLLTYLAVMALTDHVSRRVRIACCPIDGRLFASTSYQGTYCTTRCRATAEKRRQRQGSHS